jgi:hypothetical protein
MNTNSGISEGGQERLRAAVKKKITAEVERRMKEMASPQSLWGAS